jgi:Icc-related predicted phosphoesterase
MIWFLGDTHGSFRHVVEHLLEAKQDDRLPQAIVFLGDLDCARPLHVELDEIAGLTEIFWIPGNHDSDDNTAWNNLVCSDLAHRNLHCRIGQVGSSRVAGLGGVFRKKIWSPPDPPAFQTYDAWREALTGRRPTKDWGLAEMSEERRHKTSIFPDMVASLGAQRADILVSHEAPECRQDNRGWKAVGEIARCLGVRYAFHGHHHDQPDYSSSFHRLGFQAYAVGFRGITALSKDGGVSVLRPGDYDATDCSLWENSDD